MSGVPPKDSLPTHVLATAGHVDHGKSSLVRALTGTDPDRWAEEQERGLTIDLGFAWCRLPSGRAVSFVDVPGHVRFLRNMLSGVGAVAGCLLVVDAGEGWMPQTEEHLRILEALGIRHGIVALTKVATVDEESAGLAVLEIEEHLEGSPLAGSVIVATDSLAPLGLGDLTEALDTLCHHAPRAVDRGRPRLWVDRSFAARGAGTVVTGTLVDGRLAVDDNVVVEPQGLRARVRGLQTHGQSLDTADPGTRVAVNLAGIEHRQVSRGDSLVTPDRWHRTVTVDAHLDVLASLSHEVSRRGSYLAYVGSGEIPVRLRVLGRAVIAPGTGGPVRLHLRRPATLLPGDRFVLRESGRDETVGGGEVLDVDPVAQARDARPDRDVDRVVAERGWVDVAHLERLTGVSRTADVGRWAVAPEALRTTARHLEDLIAGSEELGLDVAQLDARQRAVLEQMVGIEVRDGRARRQGITDRLADHPWLASLDTDQFHPAPPSGVDPAEVRELVRRGLVVERDGVWFSAAAVDEAARVVASLLERRPAGVTVAEVRDAWGTTRKFAVPLLTILDSTGVTRRREDLRIAGPRLPPPR